MKNLKKKLIVITFLACFTFNTMAIIAASNDILSDYRIDYMKYSQKNKINFNQEIMSKDGLSYSIKGEENEYLKIIIGAPTLIDENANIQVFVAGMRSAKANYILPLNLSIKLLSEDDEFKSTYTEPTMFECKGYKEEVKFQNDNYVAIEDGRWIPDELHPVTQITSDVPIFNCTFQPLRMTAEITIEVTMTWRTPWYEILTQKATKIVQVAPWRDFQKFLDTGSAEANAMLAQRGFSNIKINGAINEMRTSLDAVTNVYSSFRDLEKFGAMDPAIFRFYVLNISSIVDPNNPNSYISKLNETNSTKYNSYMNVLTEINEAYQQAKMYLDNAGVIYTETIVNYSYTDGWDPNLNSVYNGDADIDDENLEDTSLEYLMEGLYWTTHPYLMHEPYEFMISSNDHSGNYPETLNLAAGASGNGYELFNAPQHRNENERNSKHTWIYDNYYNIFKVDINTGEYTNITDQCTLGDIKKTIYDKENDLYLNGGSSLTIPNDISSSQYNISIKYIPPARPFKHFKAIVVNLMYNMFPVLNNYYSYPLNVYEENDKLEYENLAFADIKCLANFTDYNFNPQKIETLYLVHPDEIFSELLEWDAEPITYDIPDPITSSNDTLYYSPNQSGYNIDDPRLQSSEFFEWLMNNFGYTVWYGERMPGLRTNRYYLFGDSNAWNQTALYMNFEKLELNHINGIINYTSLIANIPKSEGYIPNPLNKYKYNISNYFTGFLEFGESIPFIINFIGKPFSELVYDVDINNGIGQYEGTFSDNQLNDAISEVFEERFNASTKDLFGCTFEYSFFMLSDLIFDFSAFKNQKITYPSVTNPHYQNITFIKNDIGKDCDGLIGKNISIGDNIRPRQWNYANGLESEGIIPYSFRYLENGIYDEYQMFGLNVEINTNLLSEYMIAPYRGSRSDIVPIGMMYNGKSALIQISSQNITEGLGYAYGMIIYTYKQAYYASLSLLNELKDQYPLNSERNIEIRKKITATEDKLRTGWGETHINNYTLDFDLLNEGMLETIHYWSDPNSICAEENIYFNSSSNIGGQSIKNNEMVQPLFNKQNFVQSQSSIPKPSNPNQGAKEYDQTSQEYINSLRAEYDKNNDGYLDNDITKDYQEKYYNIWISNNNNTKVNKIIAVLNHAWNKTDAAWNISKDMQNDLKDDTTYGDTLNIEKAKKDIIQDVINDIQNLILNTVRPVIAQIGELAIELIQDITQPFLKYFYETLPESIYEKAEEAKAFAAEKLKPFKKLEDVVRVIGLIYNARGNLYNNVGNVITSISESIEPNILSITSFVPAGSVLGSYIAKYIFLGVGHVASKFGGILNNIGNMVDKLADMIVENQLKFSDAINTTIDTIAERMSSLSRAMGSQILALQKFMLKLVTNMIQDAYMAIDNLVQFIETINNTYTLIKAFFNDFTNIVNNKFMEIHEFLGNIDTLIMKSLGDTVEIIIDYAQELFPQLQQLEAELKDSEKFLTIMDFFYPPFRMARLAAGYIDYAQYYGTMSEATYYKWVDVYQPLSSISGADLGFQIYQIGDEFCDELYFITYYNGSLIDVEDFNVVIKKWTEFNEFGIRNQSDPNRTLIEGEGIIEAIVTPERFDNVTGLYKIKMSTDVPLDWQYEISLDENDPPESTISPKSGLYMVYTNGSYPGTMLVKSIINTTVYDEVTGRNKTVATSIWEEREVIMNSSWCELTYLFDSEYVQDAFLQIQVEPDNKFINSESGYMEIEAGTDNAEIKFRMINEMWSQPALYISITITSEYGTPVYNAKFPKFELMNPGIEEIRAFNLNVSKYTPSGLHKITYEIIEANGDTYQLTSYIFIKQSNVMVTIMFALIDNWWAGLTLIGCVSIIIIGFVYYRQRKDSNIERDSNYEFTKVKNLRSVIKQFEDTKFNKKDLDKLNWNQRNNNNNIDFMFI